MLKDPIKFSIPFLIIVFITSSHSTLSNFKLTISLLFLLDNKVTPMSSKLSNSLLRSSSSQKGLNFSAICFILYIAS